MPVILFIVGSGMYIAAAALVVGNLLASPVLALRAYTWLAAGELRGRSAERQLGGEIATGAAIRVAVWAGYLSVVLAATVPSTVAFVLAGFAHAVVTSIAVTCTSYLVLLAVSELLSNPPRATWRIPSASVAALVVSIAIPLLMASPLRSARNAGGEVGVAFVVAILAYPVACLVTGTTLAIAGWAHPSSKTVHGKVEEPAALLRHHRALFNAPWAASVSPTFWWGFRRWDIGRS